MKKHWGFFGDGVGLKIGVFWGFIPENPLKKFGDISGMGLTSILGIFGVLSPIHLIMPKANNFLFENLIINRCHFYLVKNSRCCSFIASIHVPNLYGPY